MKVYVLSTVTKCVPHYSCIHIKVSTIQIQCEICQQEGNTKIILKGKCAPCAQIVRSTYICLHI